MASSKPPTSNPVPNLSFFAPQADLPPGSALSPGPETPTLFKPLKIRGLALPNRILMAPLCMYSTSPTGPQMGSLTPYHTIHLGHPSLKGVALTFIEATAVQPNGRITPYCPGLWTDAQIPALRSLVDAVHGVGGRVGIQLAHAGRKASTAPPWVTEKLKGRGQSIAVGTSHYGWPSDVVGPSGIPWSEDGYHSPRELSKVDIELLVQDWAAAAKRAISAGIDAIEIHGAHGYLISSFLSPISNRRADSYGGSFENRIRFLLEIITAIRAVIPSSTPLFLRLSMTEWMESTPEAQDAGGSWAINECITLAKLLPGLGVDLLDCSSGGNHPNQKIMMHSQYQVKLAGQIRSALKDARIPLLIGAVGMITEAEDARDIVEAKAQTDKGARVTSVPDMALETNEAQQALALVEGSDALADVILIGRQLMREPEWVLRVAYRLGVDIQWPVQFHRGKFLRGSKI